MHKKLAAVFIGIALAVSAGVVAQVGGFPSRPTFQTARIGGAIVPLLSTSTAEVQSAVGADPVVTYYRNSNSNGVGIGRLRFDALDGVSTRQLYGFIQGEIASNAAGNHDGRLVFYVTGAGASAERLRITPSTMTFNSLTVATQETGSYTAGITGMTTSPTQTVTYSRTGNQVTVTIPSYAYVSNAAAFAMTGAPASIRPVTQTGSARIACINNSVTEYSVCSVAMQTDGSLVFIRNTNVTGWTAALNKGIAEFTSFTYGLQ